MKLTKFLLLFVILFISINSYSICSRYATVKYETYYGWSKNSIVQVIFATGCELSDATKSYIYSSTSVYAVIFWTEGDCSIVKLDNIFYCDYAITCDYLESHECNLSGRDKDGDEWNICINNYCY